MAGIIKSKPAEFDRNSGIGASDCAAALGLNPWCSPTELWLVKTGRKAPDPMNEAMRWGMLLEPVICDEYARRTGNKIIPAPRHIRSPGYPFLYASPDRFIADDTGMLEAKTANDAVGWGEPGTDQIPAYYMAQVQQQMAITGRTYCDVAVLIGKDDFRIYKVQFMHEAWATIARRLGQFWQSVIERSAPYSNNPDDTMAVLMAQISNGNIAIISDSQAEAVARYRSLKAQSKSNAAEIEALSIEIKRMFGRCGSIAVGGGPVLATFKSQTREGIDLKRLQMDHPDIARQYARTTTSRVLRLAGEKE